MAKYDWDKLTIEFVSRNYTLDEFSKLKNIPRGTLNRQSQKLKWYEKREQNGNETITKSFELITDDRAAQLAEQNQKDLSVAALLRDEIVRQVESGGLETKDIRALAGSLKDVQAVVRLALGASTENTDMNINTDFESWLNERIT